jgi:hypothetical protein
MTYSRPKRPTSSDAATGKKRAPLPGFVLLGVLAALSPAASFAQVSYTINPTKAQFAKTAVGVTTRDTSFTLTNTGSSDLNVDSITLTPSQFHLATGWAPTTASPGKSVPFGVNFVPDAAQTFNGQLTIYIRGASPLVLPLRGTGFITTARVSLSSPSLMFPNQGVGSASASQSVTINNVGTAPLTVQSINLDPPFILQGFAAATTLQPGTSLPLAVTFAASRMGTFYDAMVITYDVLPPNAVSLTGTTAAATSFAISSFSTLPAATVTSAYLATLTAVGGTPPYSWVLASGSNLPAGLSLSNSGTISGTLDASVGVGSYGFQVQSTDSSQNTLVTTADLKIPVGALTGATCNNTSWNIPATTTPMLALNDLATGTYLGFQGGLYPSGSNVRPVDNDAAGLAIANSILPLDANGNPDPNGKYGLISIGESNTSNTFSQFTINANADPSKNPHLVIVKGAQPTAPAYMFANPNNGVWNAISQFFLPQVGLTPNQVVAAWIQAVNSFPTGKFPDDMSTEQSQLESIARNLHAKFPNLKLAYYTSKFYDGYNNGLRNPRYPEPYAYESGFAVKWVIEDQMNGDPTLNYNPAIGDVMSPWVTWGPYEWANGLLGRSDGLVWTCQDMTNDGVHPARPAGWQKDANILLNFFKSDSTTTPWFLAH